MRHNWYPDFKAGVGLLSWGGRKRTTDGKAREHPPNETIRMEGKEEKRKEVGRCDKVSSCSAAARLPHIWNASVSWKILQERRIGEEAGGKERRSGERKGAWW